MMGAPPLRVLAINQGCGGGIGRVESLLGEAWIDLGQSMAVELRSIYKLRGNSNAERGFRDTVYGHRKTLAAKALSSWLVWQPDIVMLSHLNFGSLGLVMQTLRPSTKVVTVAHGIEAWIKLSRVRATALNRSAAVWSVSSYTKSRLSRASSIRAEKVRVLPLALAPAQLAAFEANGEHPREGRGKSILTVARLDSNNKYKGIDHVIQALPQIAKVIRDVNYTVVGAGTDRPRLQALTEQLGISSRVHFLGSISEEALAAAYRECDVFTMPSSQEGFGLVFLEAMAAGKTVVAANAGATPEVVLDDLTGLLVPYGDVWALAHALSRCLGDDELRQRMGHAGRARVAEEFTFDRFVNRFGNLVSELVH